MHFLPSAKRQIGNRRELAEEIWGLCQGVCPIIYKDMQRVVLMEHWDNVYFEEAFHEVSKDYIAISCYGMQLRKWDSLDRRSLKNRWLQLRVILAKYMDQSDIKFAKIEEHYNFMSLRGLPKIIPGQRPRSLPREWWDEHPDRDSCMDRIALVWWRLRKALPYEFEDICGTEAREGEISSETASMRLEKGPSECIFDNMEDDGSTTTKQENGLDYLL